MNVHFKKKPLTSKKAREVARGSHCTLRIPGVCQGGRDTCVLCHLNSHRKGMGNKSPDLWAVIACHKCHEWLDGRDPRGLVHSYWYEVLRALMETQEIFVENGIIIFK